MVKIRFETGQVVDFQGTPTQADIDEVAKSLQIQKPVEQPKESFLTTREPNYKASMAGGASDVPTNVAKTFANIPSSARNLARDTIAPVNPFDAKSSMNIGANIANSAFAAKDIVANRGVFGGLKDIAGGVLDTAKKGVDIYKNVGQSIYNNLEGNVEKNRSVTGGIASSVGDVAIATSKKAIEDPLLIPSIIYAPSKVRGTGVTTDTISTLARPVIDTTKKTTGLALDMTKKATTKATDTILSKFEPTTAKLESKIVEQFQKGVKPRINMNMTPTQATKFEGDIVQAVKVIDNNKPNLVFIDDVGEEIIGRNPKSLAELSDAVEQTKKKVFAEYDALAQQAGQKGLKINTNNIAGELDTVISNEALQITNPQAIKYAQELKERLSFRELDAKTVQDVIQNYNESLKAFYRNPTYDSASKASIDAMIANQMRKQLDEGITGLTGTQYQAIKNQYASLKAVEKDIIKATLRDARKNNKGLIDYTDILTGGDIVTGLVTFNPTTIARGAVMRSIKEFYKYLNDPNRAVEKMFNSTSKLNQRSIPKSQAIPSPSASVTPSGTTRLSTQPSANIPKPPSIIDIPKSITLPKGSSIEDARTFVNKYIDDTLEAISDPDTFAVIESNPQVFYRQQIDDISAGLKEGGIKYKRLADSISSIDASKITDFETLASKIREKLNQKTLMETITGKGIPNRQGGFIKNPLSQSDNLIQEAKKYKSVSDLLKSKYPDVNFSIYEKNGEINLSKIIVPKETRNSGIGTKAVNDLVDYADRTNQRITLTPTSDYGGSKSRLIDFYKKFGFVENKGKFKDFSTRELMYRQPTDNLIQEAKKYKSADFNPSTSYLKRNIDVLNKNGIKVKNPDEVLTLYHGTNATGVKGITESGSLKPSSFLATDPNASKGFVFGKGGKVLKIQVRVKDLGFVQDGGMAGSKGVSIQTIDKLVKGKDGIYRAEN